MIDNYSYDAICNMQYAIYDMQTPMPTRDGRKSKCNPSLSNNAMCRENQKQTHLRKDAPQDPYHTSTL